MESADKDLSTNKKYFHRSYAFLEINSVSNFVVLPVKNNFKLFV